MKQPTVEELEKLLREHFGTTNTRVWYSIFAKTVHEMFNPPLKPLSELADNEEDCNKLALAIYGRPMQPPVRGFMKNGGNGDWFSIETGGINKYGATLTVYKDGKIVQSGMHGKANIFKIVDEIRNLGYDVQPETKTP